MDRIPYALSLGAIGFLGYFALSAVDSISLRIDEMEMASVEESQHAGELHRELLRVTGELTRLEGELARSHASLEESRTVSDQVRSLGRAVEIQNERLDRVARAQESFDPEALDANLQTLGQELTERWESVYGVAASAAELADESRERLDALDRREKGDLWAALLGPVVQLAGEDSVGSGVLVRGPASETSTEEIDYVLTAWHVVRDIQGSLYNRDMPVPVTIYESETETRNETAELIDFDADIDVALLRLDAPALNPNTVRLATRATMDGIDIFDGIYAVGCPLGNDPIPTVGQVAATHHDVDGETYMMINAPTYVGNSGGGIFSAGRQELLGIFSKVYTHGSLRPTIVTHMGLVTPMGVVYDWMESVGYGFLVPSPVDDGPELASAREASTSEE